ncbi:MAG TPA: hypothetical protein VL866_24020 [Pyrinomonadaceae bacterium]|nr:hypothetical protein [Pyrinomonadaceae bacterium]
MLTLVITILALAGFLVLNDSYVRLREICRLTYFAALLILLLQYGAYFNSMIKEVAR